AHRAPSLACRAKYARQPSVRRIPIASTESLPPYREALLETARHGAQLGPRLRVVRPKGHAVGGAHDLSQRCRAARDGAGTRGDGDPEYRAPDPAWLAMAERVQARGSGPRRQARLAERNRD